MYKEWDISVDKEISEGDQDAARKEIGANEDVLHELKLEVVQEVWTTLLVPDVHNHSLVVESPVRWFVVLPNWSQFERIRIQKEEYSKVYLRKENTFFQVKPPSYFREKFVVFIVKISNVSVNPLLKDLRDHVRSNLTRLEYFRVEMKFVFFELHCKHLDQKGSEVAPS